MLPLLAVLLAIPAEPSSLEDLLRRAERRSSIQVRQESQAVPLFREALRQARSIGDKRQETRALTGLGHSLHQVHQYEEALRTYDEGLRLARAIGDAKGELAVLRGLGAIHMEQGRFEVALRYEEEMLQLATRRGDAASVARALNNLAATYRRQGDFIRAAGAARRALQLLDSDPRARDDRLLFSTPYLLGRSLLEMGDYPAALHYLQRALAQAERMQAIAGRWHTLNDIGLWYQLQGDWQRARSYYRRALEVAVIPDSRDMEGITLRGMAEVERARGQHQLSARLYEQATDLFTKFQVEGEVVPTLVGLGATYLDLNEPDRARPLLQRAVELAEQRQQPLGVALGRFELGRLALREKKFSVAEREYRAAYDVARRLGFLTFVPTALTGLAETARARGALDEAAALFRESADQIESLRERMPSLDQRAAFAAATHTTYEGLLDSYLDLYERSREERTIAKAFTAVERERSQNLALDQDRNDVRQTGGEEEIASILMQLSSPELSIRKRTELLDRLDDVERELTAIDPTRSETRVEESIGTLQSILKDDEIFVSLATTRSRAVAFVVTRSSLRLVSLRSTGQLENRIAFFADLLSGNGGASTLPAGRRLFRELVQPWLHLTAGKNSIFISASGALAQLPFAALPEGKAPLLQRFAISQVPSLTALAVTRRKPAHRRAGRILAIGFTTEQTSQRVSIGGESYELPRLRFVDEEIGTVRKASGGSLTRLADHAASEQAIKRANLQAYDVVHIAAHAFLDPRIASRSAIVLRAANRSEDGLLQSREISRLRANGSVVVLSSCQTALGPVSPAEGMHSLARAFSNAGSASVVGTWWRVGDRASTRFFERFYRHLSRGATVSSAIRQAQRDTFDADPYANASDWAAFMVIGDGRVAPIPARRRFLPIMPLVFGVIALALMIVLFRRLSSRA